MVSVIVPNYNHAPYLKQRIDSILLQTFGEFEVIILDDCSIDNSKEIIEQYRSNKKISQILYNEHNSGSTFKQWQKGMELAKGEYIWIAESDDVAEANFLEEVMKPFKIDQDIILSSCRSIVIDEHNNHLGLQASSDVLNPVKWNHDYVEDARMERKKYLQFMNTLPNASAVVFKKPGNVDNVLRVDMKFCGDWLFWKNILKTGKIAYTSKPLNYFRRHQQTTRVKSNNISDEILRFKELNMFVEPTLINIAETRYDWIIHEWEERKSKFKNTRYFYTTLLHPTLALRYYIKSLKRLLKVS